MEKAYQSAKKRMTEHLHIRKQKNTKENKTKCKMHVFK